MYKNINKTEKLEGKHKKNIYIYIYIKKKRNIFKKITQPDP